MCPDSLTVDTRLAVVRAAISSDLDLTAGLLVLVVSAVPSALSDRVPLLSRYADAADVID